MKRGVSGIGVTDSQESALSKLEIPAAKDNQPAPQQVPLCVDKGDATGNPVDQQVPISVGVTKDRKLRTKR